MASDTIFGKIIRGELPAEKVFENEHVVAIKDIYPQAPVHILIIPKKQFPDIQSLPDNEMHLLGEVVKAAQVLAEQYNITNGYRLLTNNGSLAGQTIYHLHFHLLGGGKLGGLG